MDRLTQRCPSGFRNEIFTFSDLRDRRDILKYVNRIPPFTEISDRWLLNNIISHPSFLMDKDNTMNIIFVVIAVSVGFVILWFALYRKKGAGKAVTYVCEQCGERHCNCNRMDEVNPSDKD